MRATKTLHLLAVRNRTSQNLLTTASGYLSFCDLQPIYLAIVVMYAFKHTWVHWLASPGGVLLPWCRPPSQQGLLGLIRVV